MAVTTALQTDPRNVCRFTKSEIAALTPSDIAKLTFDEMVEVVIASEISVRRIDQIRNFEGETLVRLVYSARSHCRPSS